MTGTREVEIRVLNLLRSPAFYAQHGHVIKAKYLSPEGRAVYAGIVNLHQRVKKSFILTSEDYTDGILAHKDIESVVKSRHKGKELSPVTQFIRAMTDYTSDLKNPGVARALYEDWQSEQVVRDLLIAASTQQENRKFDFDALRQLIAFEEHPAALGGAKPADFGTLIKRVTMQYKDRIATGFPKVDENFQGGVGPGELMIVGGFAKSGKTSFLTSVALNEMRQNRPVLYFSLADLHSTELEVRVACQIHELTEAEVIKKPRLIEEIKRWQEKHKNYFLPVDLGHQKKSPAIIESIIAATKKEHPGLRLVIVDRAEMMAYSTGDNQFRHRVMEIFAGLRGVAYNTKVAMIADSQTNERSEWSKIVTPSMAHESKVDKPAILDMWVGIGRQREEPDARFFFLFGRRRILQSVHRFKFHYDYFSFEPEADYTDGEG